MNIFSGAFPTPAGFGWEELCCLFREAEAALHEAEMIHGDLAIPSVNQLRYAGRHIVAAPTCQTPEEAAEELQKAKRHCQRAIYDAFDSAVSYLLKNIDMFKADYRTIEITPTFPDYPKVRDKARQAQGILVRAREVHDDRGNYYEECRNIARELKGQYDLLEDAREELNKAVRKHNREIIVVWSTVFAVIAGLAALIAGSAALL